MTNKRELVTRKKSPWISTLDYTRVAIVKARLNTNEEDAVFHHRTISPITGEHDR